MSTQKATIIESDDTFRLYRRSQEEFKFYVEELKERISKGEKFKTFHFLEGNLELAKDRDGFYKIESIENLVSYLNHFFPKKSK